MESTLALIGYGEAGRTFSTAADWGSGTRVFDIRDLSSHYAEDGVTGCATLADAIDCAQTLLSLVTADQALVAAQNAAQHIAPGALFFDMNSVAPETKRAAAAVIEAAGGQYLDVAVMAPVQPARLAVPLLVSGPNGDEGAAALSHLGFTNVRVMPGEIGRASAVKMIRSIIVKGIEALTAEMLLAGEAAGVTDEVLASLGDDWGRKADYNLDRMLVHGTRRAAEMTEVAKTLEALGVVPVMTRGTIRRQAEIGAIGAGSPEGLTAKLRIAA